MALNNTTLYTDIKNTVLAALKTVTTNIPKIENGEVTGEEALKIFDADEVQAKYGTDARRMTYKGSKSGIEAIVDVIADKVAEKVISHFIANLEIVAKDRIDNYGTEVDTMITAIDAIAATATATGITPVTGATLGTLFTTLSTAMKIGQATRSVLQNAETIIGTQIK